jgi:hypothetical protein
MATITTVSRGFNIVSTTLTKDTRVDLTQTSGLTPYGLPF